MSSIPVLITQHEAGAPPGTVLEALIDAGLTVDVREPFAGEALPEPRRIDDFSGLVVLGGAMNVDEEGRFPFLAEERVLLAEALRRDVPILGICLGAQQLAAAIGGEVFTRPEPEVGWLPVDVVVTSDPLFAGVENPFHAFQWHAQSFTVPDAAVVLATRPDGVGVQAFTAAPRAWGIQFHPEITEAMLHDWIARDSKGMRRRAPGLLEGLLKEAGTITSESRRLCRTLVRNWVQTF